MTRWFQWWRLLGGEWAQSPRQLRSGYVVVLDDWRSARLVAPDGVTVDFLCTGALSPLRWRLTRAHRRAGRRASDLKSLHRTKALR